MHLPHLPFTDLHLPPLLPLLGPMPLQPQAALPAFEQALHRAGRGGRAAPGDEETALPDASTAPPPLQAAPDTPAPAPQPVAAPDAVTTHLRALNLPAEPAAAGQWQLQWPGLDAPLLQVQRGAEGALHLVLSTTPELQRSTPMAALRDRLQARGQSLETRSHGPHRSAADKPDRPEEPA